MTAPVQGPPARAVGVFRRWMHLLDPDARVIDFRGVRLHVAQCGAMAAMIKGRADGPHIWCPRCLP